MPATEPRLPLNELARLGTAVYAEKVRPLLKPEDDGKFVALDVHSGDYEIDEDDYTAVARLEARRPDAEMWLECAGQPTTYRMGSGR